ncbi:hypothetical protein HOLleu_15172 [Holothuria leucospilota]|uniref:Uncharacterized protein n=1 Tax=Holothuria leucospilota TaxID=206669 RepID=A0A9Q1CA37_HOLLE|nr:hypothetical protein HOLleu_15172 [Holothuria leucospilota]
MNMSNLIYLAAFATVSAFLMHTVSSISYNTIDGTIPYKRLFWIDKKSSYDDSSLYTVPISSAPSIVECFLDDCTKNFATCAKSCIMTNEEIPCMTACKQQRTVCSIRCFQRYAMKSSDNAA